MGIIKSPIFYMGNKYELLPNLLTYFPKKETVSEFIDLFGGSGVVSLNVPYDNVRYNELNENIFELLKTIITAKPNDTIKHIKNRIKEYNLPTKGVEKGNDDYEKFEKNYYNFRNFYNKQKEKNYLDLFTLTFFSFSNLIRFNNKKEFNMPYGHRCFLSREHDANIYLAHNVFNSKNIAMINEDAFELLSKITTNNNQFIYLDPPYSNTLAIYNKKRAGGGWNIDDDNKLFQELNRLNKLGIKWAMSNVLENKGMKNTHIEKWAIENNYKIIEFRGKEYFALGKGNANTREVLIINYVAPFEKFDIFDFME